MDRSFFARGQITMLSDDRVPFLPEHHRPGPVQLPRSGPKATSVWDATRSATRGAPATHPPPPRGPHREPRWRWSRRGFLPTPRAHRFGRCHLHYRSGGSAPVPRQGAQYPHWTPSMLAPAKQAHLSSSHYTAALRGRGSEAVCHWTARAAALDPSSTPHSFVRGALRKNFPSFRVKAFGSGKIFAPPGSAPGP